MNTNFHGSIFPDCCVGAKVMSKEGSKAGSIHDMEIRSPWCDHVVCMEGESSNDGVFEEEVFEPHVQWGHLLS